MGLVVDPSELGMAVTECGEDQASAPGSEALDSEMELVCSLAIRSHPSMGSGRATRSTEASEEDVRERLLTSWEPTGRYPTQVSK